MQYSIPFGASQVSFRVPESNPVIFKGEMKALPAITNLNEAIVKALENPIGTPPLSELVKGKKNIVFLVEDATRSTPLHLILPVIVGYLNKHGIPDSCMSCLTAPGTHRIMTEAEIEDKIGSEMKKRLRVFQHDPNKSDEIEDVGTVTAGEYRIPVHINRRALRSDFLIGLGNIVPHCDAGFSGGAKILQPGVCDFVSTSATHAAAAFCHDIPLGMAEGNPCREGLEAVARKVGFTFIFNVVKNCDGDISGIFAGDVIKAHRAGAEMSARSFKIDVPKPADVVVVSSYPADLDYWQAEKGIISAYFAVKKGGIIIFVTPCPEGLAQNHPRFREWLAMSHADILKRLRTIEPEDVEADVVSAVLAGCNSRTREKARIYAVCDGLTDEDMEALKYTRFPTVQAALDKALEEIPGASVGIIPQGGISLPVLA